MMFLKLGQIPLNEWTPENQSRTHRKCSKKGLVKGEINQQNEIYQHESFKKVFQKVKAWNSPSTDEKSKTI